MTLAELFQAEFATRERYAKWDESKHPRAADGKFGSGGGSEATERPANDQSKENASRDQLASLASKELKALGAKLKYIAGSDGSLYYSVVSDDENEWVFLDKIRFSDHADLRVSSAQYQEPLFDFVEGAGDVESQWEMMIDQVKEEIEQVKKETEATDERPANDQPSATGDSPVASWAAKRFKDPAHAKAFTEWFGDSKVVDENGEPLTVYHGTDAEFDEFDRDMVKSRYPYSFGFHFTSRPQEASVYATEDTKESGGNVMPLFLKANNPLEIHTEHPAASMELDINKAEIIHTLMDARRAGKPYDSVIVHRKRGDEWDQINVVVFDPTQIKSATGNRGTFDPDNPKINYEAEHYDRSTGQKKSKRKDDQTMLFSAAATVHLGSLLASEFASRGYAPRGEN